MKKIYLLIVVAMLTWACGSSEEKQRAEMKAKVKAELTNHKRLSLLIDGLITDLVIKQGKAGFEVMDSSEYPIITFPLAYDTVAYPVGEDMTVLGVLMQDRLKGDSLNVDFKLQWDPNIKVNDTTMGEFKLIAAEVRAKKGVERYRWVKQGEFFIKQAKLLQ
ncbi:hypothetical protein [Rhodoflexus sp.]